MEPYEGFKRVKEGRFAFYCEKATALSVIRRLFDPHEVCDTKEIVFRKNIPVVIALKKFSPLRERFLINWLRMIESGIVRKKLLDWNIEMPKCASQNYYESVRFEYAAPVFLFLVTSYFVSVCLLALEKYRKESSMWKAFIEANQPLRRHIFFSVALIRGKYCTIS